MRIAARGLRLVILVAFAVFFVIPIGWLILAPTKADGALVTSSPLSFGSFRQVALAWDHIDVKKPGRAFLEKEQQRSLLQLGVMANAT